MTKRHALPVAAGLAAAVLALTSTSQAEAASALRHKNSRSGYCLGMHSSRSTINLMGCGSSRTYWKSYAATYVGGKKYVKLKSIHNRKCLGVAGQSTAGGAALAWGNCTSTRDHSQLWRVHYVRGGNYLIINADSGKCVGTRGSSTAKGTLVVQGRCNSATGSTQLWKRL
ncbi:RICIN domain-containing protein [Streptomyces sp. NPDC058145]|uniref:RICIN domain-containing protein n=1 Tax=Streptomyces sp. NPDC058145 TaxID=3346356 RepID=UPI0036E443FC